MKTQTFITNKFVERGVQLTIVRKEISNGLSVLADGEITLQNEDRLLLSASDIIALQKIFSAAEDKGLCI